MPPSPAGAATAYARVDSRCPTARLPIGTTEIGAQIRGVMVTMDGEQGAEAVRIIDPRVAIPIHYDDCDVFTSPLSDFLDAAVAAGVADRVRELDRGDTYRLD